MKSIIKFGYLFIVVILASCSHSSSNEHLKSNFKVTSAVQKDTVVNKEYISQIHAFQHIELRSLEKGYLQNIFVDEGQHVKKGMLLFQIQPTIYQAESQSAQAETKSAEAEVEFTEVEYNNVKALADQGHCIP